MSIDNLNYHGWRGDLHSPWLGCLAIVRVALLQVFRRKSYWFVFALGLLQFLAFWMVIYIVTQIPEARGFKEFILERFSFSAEPVEGTENGYIEFMWRQSIVVTILLAFAGSLLVGTDFSQRSLPFYLSRRIDRRHYIVGKIMAVSSVISLITIVPALLLFVEYGMFSSNFDYWTDNWRIAVAVLCYGLVLCVVLSILLVTLSAYLQRMAPIAITWSSIFILSPILCALAKIGSDSPYWNLIDPWRDMRMVGRLCFATVIDPVDRELAWWSLGLLVTVCCVSLAALVHRVRAVDIVE